MCTSVQGLKLLLCMMVFLIILCGCLAATCCSATQCAQKVCNSRCLCCVSKTGRLRLPCREHCATSYSLSVLIADSEIAPAFIDFCQRQLVGSKRNLLLVAHNGKVFDFPYIKKDFALEGISLPDGWCWLDTVLLARSHLRLKQGHTQVRASHCCWSICIGCNSIFASV